MELEPGCDYFKVKSPGDESLFDADLYDNGKVYIDNVFSKRSIR